MPNNKKPGGKGLTRSSRQSLAGLQSFVPSLKPSRNPKAAKAVKAAKLAADAKLAASTASHKLATLARSNTTAYTQTEPDCIQKAHSRLLSNYFSYLLKTNDVKRINKLSFNFDTYLDTYSVEEDNASGGKDWVHGYGGGLSDVIAKINAGILNLTTEPEYAKIFTKPEISFLRQVLNGMPKDDDGMPQVVIESDDNSILDDHGNIIGIWNPGDSTIIKSVTDFMNNGSLFYPSSSPGILLFKSYISVDILLVPSMYYWLGSLDGVSNIIPDGITPPAELVNIMRAELRTVTWSNIKYTSTHAEDKQLRAYLNTRGIIVDPSTYEYPGHALVIKGYDPNYLGNGACYLIQNSWGPSWNRKITTCTKGGSGRWIDASIIDALIYGVLRIVFPQNYGFGITKRKRKRVSFKKPNKSKSKRKQTRRLKK